jgi:predicted aspartyl protease
MKRSAPVSLLLALAAVAMVPDIASAQIFRWLDGEGDIHYSQGVDSVPLRFRPAAVIIGYDREILPDPPSASTAAGRVKFSPGQPIMVTARVNDRDSVQLMVDTGAARTVISPAVLNTLGVSFDNAMKGSLKGVTGAADVVAVRVESIEVSGMRYGPLAVVSHDTGFGPGRGDGLLGRDFLDNFTITIDNAAGVLTLTPR